MHVVSPSKGYIFATHAKDLQRCRRGVRWIHTRLFRFANMPIYMSILLLS